MKKSTAKKIVKTAKKNNLLGLLIIVVVILVIGYFAYNYIKTNFIDKEEDTTVSGDLIISFLELGNKYTGDAIYIKAGDTDVLIDAGSRNGSSDAISDFIDDYVTDNKLEYVIATHAHQDHIAGFVGTKAAPGIFDRYECETIIDFPLTNSTTALYSNYIEKRDAEVSAGAKHFTALECYNNENGASRTYQLSDDVTLEILYNYYYENTSSNENNYSVCFIINQGSRHFLFTGDLETEGEKKLIENNDLPKVDLFKAAHHGSGTANSNELLSVIKPDIICVTCVAGSTEYSKDNNNTFPYQSFVDRVKNYTDKIYVTSVATYDKDGKDIDATSMNGNIIIVSDVEGIKINCSNNNTILKDTTWFSEHRTW